MTILCRLSDLNSDYPLKVILPDGEAIAVYLVEGNVYATADICSHGDASLSDGYMEGYNVVCPFHLGAFDVRTGEATKDPCFKAVKSYSVRCDGDQVILEAVADVA